MKKLSTLLLILFGLTLFAQDKIIVHTVTNDNLLTGSPNTTVIDHPDLNGNINAKIIVKQTTYPSGVINDHAINVWYFNNQWSISNTDVSSLPIGASFNVFIGGEDSEMIFHFSTDQNSTNIGSSINSPLFNGQNPGPPAVFTSKFEPGVSGVPTVPLGFEYLNGSRRIYAQDLVSFQAGWSFNVVVPSGDDSFTHVTGSSNISGNETIIDHPLLNFNPDASFVFEHYYGLQGNLNDFDHHLGISYNSVSGRWEIFSQDNAPFISGLAFHIMVVPFESSPNPIEIELPITFEEPQQNYNLGSFNGVEAAIVNNPNTTGIINTSPFVLRHIQNADPSVFGGAFVDVSSPIEFTQPFVAMDVWVPTEAGGTAVTLKFEIEGNPFDDFIEVSKTTTTSGEWETLIFDFSDQLEGNTNDYVRVVTFFNVGLPNTSQTYFCDNIRLVNSPLSTQLNSPLKKLAVFPNPANDQLSIDLELNESSDLSVQLVNVLGQVLKSIDLGNRSSGTIREYIDINDLSEGMYVLNISAGDYQRSRKVQVVR